MNLIASKNPEYQALRTKSRSLARLWSTGHAVFCFSFLSLFAAVEFAGMIAMELVETPERAQWPVVGSFLIMAAVCFWGGRMLMRHAVRKGRRTVKVAARAA